MSDAKATARARRSRSSADDDLLSELDAWDATFDALHGSEQGSPAPAEQVMEWPAPDPTTETRAAPPRAVTVRSRACSISTTR